MLCQALPDSTVDIDLSTESFIGSAVDDAEVTIEWSVVGKVIRQCAWVPLQCV